MFQSVSVGLRWSEDGFDWSEISQHHGHLPPSGADGADGWSGGMQEGPESSLSRAFIAEMCTQEVNTATSSLRSHQSLTLTQAAARGGASTGLLPCSEAGKWAQLTDALSLLHCFHASAPTVVQQGKSVRQRRLLSSRPTISRATAR